MNYFSELTFGLHNSESRHVINFNGNLNQFTFNPLIQQQQMPKNSNSKQKKQKNTTLDQENKNLKSSCKKSTQLTAKNIKIDQKQTSLDSFVFKKPATINLAQNLQLQIDHMKRGNANSPKNHGKKKIKTNKVQQKSLILNESDIDEDDNIIKFVGDDDNDKIGQSKAIATPWISRQTADMRDSLLRFHNQIYQFFHYIALTKSQKQLRNNTIAPQAELRVHGSFAVDLSLPDGDIDLVIIVDEEQHNQRNIENKMYLKLCSHKSFKQVQYIRHSKVPIVKGKTLYGIQFDISVNKLDGIKQISNIINMKLYYPEFKYLFIVFKCVLKIRGLSETYTGGIGSFLLYSMIVHYLRDSKNLGLTLGHHVISFLDFWTNKDWSQYVIDGSTGKTTRQQKDGSALRLISPQDPSHDIGKGAFKIKQIFIVFKNRLRLLQNKNFKRGQSMLKQLVNPMKQLFVYLRK